MLAHGWQTNFERSVVRSREAFKFWWAPTVSGMAEARVVKFCMHVGCVKYQHKDDKSPLKGRGQNHVTH